MTWLWLIILLILSFLGNLFIGSVDIPAADVADILLGTADAESPESYIVLQNRLPGAIAAILGGGGLAVAGLLMQTSFRNPLAGPSIMGINSGASLGVAVVMLLMGGVVTSGAGAIGGEAAVMIGALAGSFLIMAVLLWLSTILRNDLMLLIAGILIGYLASSVITLLNFGATSQGVQSYVMWGMGSFQNVAMARMPVFAVLVVAGLALSFCLVKPLDALLLGDEYAMNLGVNIRRTRQLLLLATGILAAAVTAYCGPVSFIGLAVPHIARMLIRTDIHRRLLPVTLLTGCVIALLCNIIAILPSSSLLSGFSTTGVLPLNAVTPLFGVPVILYVILRRR